MDSYEELIERLTPTINNIHQGSRIRAQLLHQTKQISQWISELKGQKSRSRRSINWIGSAWKWIAGSPDATDWDQIVKSQNQVINNNNQQYKINRVLMETSQQMLNEFNKIVEHLKEDEDDKMQQTLYNRLTLIKEEVKEIIRAVQLAKGKIVNTNLLDKGEISRLITEIETLPYSNEIEAIEYAEPMMMVKESTILYVISIPKTSKQNYNHVIVKSTVNQNKQIHLEFNELLLNQDELFGITQRCNLFRDITICERSKLKELSNDHCINQIIKGLNARCDYQFNNNQIIEPLNDNTIFLSNFKGDIVYSNRSKHLTGNFLIQYHNETIKIGESTFTNKEARASQILPPVLKANITEKSIKIDPGYLHNLYLNNVEQLQELFNEHKEAVLIDFSIIIIITCLVVIFLANKARIRRQRRMLFINKPTYQDGISSDQPGIQPRKLSF